MKRGKLFYEITFAIGMILIFAQLPFILKTIIDFYIPIIIVLIVGFISCLIDYKNYSNLYDYIGKKRYLYPFIHFSASYGGIVLFVFSSFNYYLSKSIETTTEYNIVDRGTYNIKNSSGKKPYFVIKYNGKNKEIVFGEIDYKTVEKELSESKKIELTTKKGFFDYEILISKKMIKR